MPESTAAAQSPRRAAAACVPGGGMGAIWLLVAGIGLLLAGANGANDNFKGVATLLGSGTTRYRPALTWATLTTAAGSVAALFLARRLLVAFSGKGLVPSDVAGDPHFTLAVAGAAALTVLLATRLGLPISTTHALIGALVGAGLVASPQGVETSQLAGAFLLPLVLSPLLAMAFAGLLYPPLHAARRRLGIAHETCVCIGREVLGTLPGSLGAAQALRAVSLPTLEVGKEATCHVRYQGNLFGVSVRRLLDTLHFLSAGVVSFARGVNDTPKIAALLLLGQVLAPTSALVGTGLAMALGALVGARRVARTLAHKVTEMNPGQGAVANLVTGLLVIGASHLGMPVSTTHVAGGALFGVGAATRQAHWETVRRIAAAWLVTLPLAAGVAMAMLGALRAVL